MSYPTEVRWNVSSHWNRLPATAAQGNMLEAINTTLNLLRLHYMDRDLERSGNSLVIVSAGSGVFEIDKGLAVYTKQRMMDHGIGKAVNHINIKSIFVLSCRMFCGVKLILFVFI